MGVQKDAGELLAYSYKKYTEGHMTDGHEFMKESGWDTKKAHNALNYLKDKQLIKGTFEMGSGFMIERILPDGIDIMEDTKKFEHTFGFGITAPQYFHNLLILPS